MKMGDKLPKMKFLCTDAAIHSFDDLKGKNLVLYFYPKDNTPGCTIESKAFRDLYPEFVKLNTQILGISRDSLVSHEKFSAKHCFPFPLIADHDEKLCEFFDVLAEKSLFGKKFKGVVRSTFLFDSTGTLRHIWPKVSIKNHAKEVLSVIKSF